MTAVVATNVTFSVSVFSSSSALRYQWRFNGTDIVGATNNSYTLTSVSIASQGRFQVLVSDPVSSALSDPAILNVLVAPVLTQALPAAATAVQGDTVSWTASASGFPLPLNFQWRRAGTILTNI